MSETAPLYGDRRDLTDEEYQLAQDQLILLAEFLGAHDWPAFIARIDAVPPEPLLSVLAPFSFRQLRDAETRLTHLRAMAKAAVELVAAKRALDDHVRGRTP